MGQGNSNRSPFLSTGASLLPDGASLPLDWRAVSPGYFRVMGIPLMAGRDFTEQDTPGATDVVVVSRAAARKLWGNENPIGKMLHRPTQTNSFTVVGVAGGAGVRMLGRRGRLVAGLDRDVDFGHGRTA